MPWDFQRFPKKNQAISRPSRWAMNCWAIRPERPEWAVSHLIASARSSADGRQMFRLRAIDSTIRRYSSWLGGAKVKVMPNRSDREIFSLMVSQEWMSSALAPVRSVQVSLIRCHLKSDAADLRWHKSAHCPVWFPHRLPSSISDDGIRFQILQMKDRP